MLRENEISAEEQMRADLVNFPGDAFHKKITVREGTRLPRNFNYAGRAASGPDGEPLINYVAKDNVKVPPEIEVIAIVEFGEGVAFAGPWKASNPPYELYMDVHTHEPANASLGGIPVKQVKVE